MFLIIERACKKKQVFYGIPMVVKSIYTLLIVIIGWVLFRAPNLTQALNYLRVMAGLSGNALSDTLSGLLFWDNFVLLIVAAVCCTPLLTKFKAYCEKKAKHKVGLDVAFSLGYIGLFIVAISYTVISTYNPFIYFNF